MGFACVAKQNALISETIQGVSMNLTPKSNLNQTKTLKIYTIIVIGAYPGFTF
jgi:hypothetical protein